MAFSDCDDEIENENFKYDCDQLRRKIKTFLASGKMTQTAFLKETNVNSNSFRRFMSYKGPFTGCNNGMYSSGNKFFAKLEATKKKEAGASNTSSTGSSNISKSKVNDQKSKADKEDALAVFLATLESVPVETGGFPLLEDCDMVRKKILEFLEKEPKLMTKAAFCRYLGINSNALSRFITYSGPFEGWRSNVYAKAFAFFERKRLAFNEPKSKKRLDFEAKFPNGLLFRGSF
jgi:hypothetical protein